MSRNKNYLIDNDETLRPAACFLGGLFAGLIIGGTIIYYLCTAHI